MKIPDDKSQQMEVAQSTTTILVVEDEILIRWATAEDLRILGFAVLQAGNADEALAILKTHREVDAVVTDIRMPGSMDGLQLAREVRENYPNVKIIAISAHSPGWQGAQLLDGFIGKPYDRSRLFERLRMILKVSS
jgi:CheY-like chemotaxis protein